MERYIIKCVFNLFKHIYERVEKYINKSFIAPVINKTVPQFVRYGLLQGNRF